MLQRQHNYIVSNRYCRTSLSSVCSKINLVMTQMYELPHKDRENILHSHQRECCNINWQQTLAAVGIAVCT